MSFKFKLLLTLPLVICTFLVSGQGIVGEDIINNGLISGMEGSFTNGAFVNQIGNRNNAEINQTQTGQQIGGGQGPAQLLNQFFGMGQGEFTEGDGLALIPSLSFSSSNIAAINQIGRRNDAQITQDGQGLVSLANQIGRRNIAILTSEGQNILTLSNQIGRRNSVEMTSEGRNIVGLSNQIGKGNSIESSVTGNTFLGANVTLYNQIGRDNSIDVTVNSGNFGLGLQTVIVNQTGDGNSLTSTVEGNRNHVRVNQTGGMVVNMSGYMPRN